MGGNKTKNKNTGKNFLKAGIASVICFVLIAASFFSVVHVGSSENMPSEVLLNNKSSQAITKEYNKQPVPLNGRVTYPEDLSNHNNTADYLIITSDAFYYPAKQDHENGTLDDRLNELAHWRAEYNGFDVAVVNVNDSFIGGNTDTNIKNFTTYVYENWSAPHMSNGKLGYILLVGDTPYVAAPPCFGDIEGGGVSDRWYGWIDDNNIPDIMIGRFSVDNYTELDAIANKTIQYEKNWELDDWHKKVLMAKGGWRNYNGYSFIKENLLELGGWEVFEVFRGEGGTTADVYNNINEGRKIVVYLGHGMPRGWENLSYQGPGYIFEEFDMDQLNNSGKFPIIYSLSCSTGKFQGSEDCMGEFLLNTPDKGAVAFFGASMSTLGSPSFANYLFESIFEDFIYIVGDVVNEGIIQEGGDWVEYNLLGDPALDLSGSKGYPNRLKPDLTLSHLNITISPENPTPEDEEVTINTTIHNIGRCTANNVTVRFIVANQDGDQHIIGEQTIDSEIPPDSHSELIQTANISEFGRTLIVQIDPNNSIDEAYELNNQAGITNYPTADAYGPYEGVVDQPIQFNGSATAVFLPCSWYWDFGDNSNSTEQDPIHHYTQTGEYTVTLTVTDYVGNTANNTTTAIITEPEPLIVSACGPYEGVVGQPIQFNGQATGGVPPYTWYWDFGDNSNSTEQDPIHHYTQAGEYTVTLTVTDYVDNTANNTTTATITEPGPLTIIISGPYIGFVDETIVFSGEVEGGVPPYNWSWDFGDGFISYDVNPIYAYNEPGTYQVLLTVKDYIGNTANDTTYATIYPSHPVFVHVDDDYNDTTPGWGYDHFDNIEDAIYMVAEDGTIIVHNGTYDECVVITKPLNLLGEDKNNTIIDGNGCEDVVKITADWVNARNFTIQNGSNAGIYVESNYNSIVGNTILNNTYGIYLREANNNNISKNTITNNIYGIYLLGDSIGGGSFSNTLSWNIITNNDNGVYLTYSSNNDISENVISNNNGTGIVLLYSNSNIVTGSTIVDNNGTGVVLRHSEGNAVTGNNIKNNERAVFLRESSNNIISENLIANNNPRGIVLKFSSNNNIIYHNNLINNEVGNALDECSNTWYNDTLEEGNYWSDYADQHPDPKDEQPPYGIWDEPYNISGTVPPNQDIYPFIDPDGWLIPDIPGDLDHDGDVDFFDLLQLLANYGTIEGATYEEGDIDSDGDVDLADLAELLGNYGYPDS